jgi:hypothetical protein
MHGRAIFSTVVIGVAIVVLLLTIYLVRRDRPQQPRRTKAEIARPQPRSMAGFQRRVIRDLRRAGRR